MGLMAEMKSIVTITVLCLVEFTHSHMTKILSLVFCCLLLAVRIKAQFVQPYINPNFPSVDGTVKSVAFSGNTCFIGGKFNSLAPATGGGATISPRSGHETGHVLNVHGDVFASIPDGNGGWYIGGRFDMVGSQPRSNLAHLLAGNVLDTSWHADVNGTVYALTILGNNLYLGGDFSQVEGVARDFVACVRLNSGRLQPWTASPNGIVRALETDGDMVYLGGDFTTLRGTPANHIGRVTSAGIIYTWIADASGGRVNALKYDNGLMYVGGAFTLLAGVTRHGAGCFNVSTNSQLTAWNPDVSGSVYTISVDTTRRQVFLGGSFTTVGGQNRNNVALVNGLTGQVTSWACLLPQSIIFASSVKSDTLYIGGSFTTIVDILNPTIIKPRANVFSVDLRTGAETAWSPNADNVVYTLSAVSNNVYVGGVFSKIAGRSRKNLAAFDKTTGILLDFEMPVRMLDSRNREIDGWLETVVADGNVLLIGGHFNTVGNQPTPNRTNVAALDITSGALLLWAPSLDNNYVHVIKPTGRGTTFLGGDFFGANGVTSHGIIEIDNFGNPTGWRQRAFNAISVYSIALTPTTVIVGGLIYGLSASKGMVEFNLSDGNLTSWSPQLFGPVNTCVYDIQIHGDKLYAAGNFEEVNGVPRDKVVCFDMPTKEVVIWRPQLPGPGAVKKFLIRNNIMYTAGNFRSVGGGGSQTLSAFDIRTGAATTWSPSFTDTAANALDTIGNTLLVGGSFTGVNNRALKGLVGLEICPTMPAPSFANSAPYIICEGDSVVLTGPTSLNHSWSTGDTTNSIVVRSAGQYSVRVRTADCGSGYSIPVQVIVNPRPMNLSITQNTDTLNAPFQAGLTYQWYLGSVPITGATSSSLVASASGTYKVVVTTSLGCSDSATLVVTELQNQIAGNLSKVYPVPTSNGITIEYNRQLPATYKVMNSMGQEVLVGQLLVTKETVSLEALPQGLYWLLFSDGERTHLIKR